MGKSWKNPIKAEAAQKRGAVFTKLAREIAVAARLGGPDPDSNSRLRLAVNLAKNHSCPKDTIERAIRKGAGLDDSAQIEEVMYEGYGPHQVGVMVLCQTDNRHRTAPEMRNYFKSNGGNLGEMGSVAWMFDKVSLVTASKNPPPNDPEEEAIEVGANEVEEGDENATFHYYGSLEDLETLRQGLMARGWEIKAAEPSFKAKNVTQLSPEQMQEVEKFLEGLNDEDDTHRIYATV